MQIVIDIDDERYKDIQRIAEVQLGLARFQTAEQIIAKGTPLPKTGWIPVSDGLPKTITDDGIQEINEYLVTVATKYPEEDWEYETDIAWNWGSYIDDFWDTSNDWKDGCEVHVVAWMPLPEPYKAGGEE